MASSSAIWPFNTPYMKAKQPCDNAMRRARSIPDARDYMSRREYLSELDSYRATSIKKDPAYRDWYVIYYREMKNHVNAVWNEPTLNADQAEDLVEIRCEARTPSVKGQLERTDPKK